jgi:hypothetical protein
VHIVDVEGAVEAARRRVAASRQAQGESVSQVLCRVHKDLSDLHRHGAPAAPGGTGAGAALNGEGEVRRREGGGGSPRHQAARVGGGGGEPETSGGVDTAGLPHTGVWEGEKGVIRNDDSVTWSPANDCTGTGTGRQREEELEGGEGEEEAEEAEDVVTARGRRREEEEVICNVCWEPLRGGKKIRKKRENLTSQLH